MSMENSLVLKTKGVVTNPMIRPFNGNVLKVVVNNIRANHPFIIQYESTEGTDMVLYDEYKNPIKTWGKTVYNAFRGSDISKTGTYYLHINNAHLLTHLDCLTYNDEGTAQINDDIEVYWYNINEYTGFTQFPATYGVIADITDFDNKNITKLHVTSKNLKLNVDDCKFVNLERVTCSSLAGFRGSIEGWIESLYQRGRRSGTLTLDLFVLDCNLTYNGRQHHNSVRYVCEFSQAGCVVTPTYLPINWIGTYNGKTWTYEE